MTSKLRESNVLVFGCTHLPFEHKHALEFVKEIQMRCKCKKVICLGDLVDNHSISYHEHDPNGWSPLHEMEATDRHLEKWFRAFPEMVITRGNHDCLVDRKGKTVGLPQRAFKPFRDIWNLPDKWEDCFEYQYHGVLYKHGTFYSGDSAHMKAAYDARQSCVIAHTHTNGSTGYIANDKQSIFGMNVGCLIDRSSYAFAYGKDFKHKPVLGCGVVTDYGKYCQFFKMLD